MRLEYRASKRASSDIEFMERRDRNSQSYFKRSSAYLAAAFNHLGINAHGFSEHRGTRDESRDRDRDPVALREVFALEDSVLAGDNLMPAVVVKPGRSRLGYETG